MFKKKPVDITKQQLVCRSAVLIGPAYQLLSSESEKAAILDMIVGRALLALVRLPLVPFASAKEGQYDQDRNHEKKKIMFASAPNPPSGIHEFHDSLMGQ